jgi:ABC-type molybdate transport system substrate-binding protein
MKYFFALFTVLFCFLAFSQQTQTQPHARLQVYGPLSLRDTMDELSKIYERTNPAWKVELETANTGDIAGYLNTKQPMDVFVLAGEKEFSALTAKNLILPGSGEKLLSEEVIIIGSTSGSAQSQTQTQTKTAGAAQTQTAPSTQSAPTQTAPTQSAPTQTRNTQTVPSPQTEEVMERDEAPEITQPKDLLYPDLKGIALLPQTKPFGKQCRDYLTKTGLMPSLTGKIVEVKNMKEALEKIKSGAAQWTFVNSAVASSHPELKVLWHVPAGDMPMDVYYAAIPAYATHLDASKAFVKVLRSTIAVMMFRNEGYIVPDSPQSQIRPARQTQTQTRPARHPHPHNKKKKPKKPQG